MINLLPPQEKEFLAGTIRQKTALTLCFIVLVFFISLTLIMISVNISISSNVLVQKSILENKQKRLNNEEMTVLKEKISKANKNFSELSAFYSGSPSFTAFLAEISNLLPSGIHLESISINPQEKENNIFQVYIAAYASSVEDVILLNDNLKNDNNLSQISFPQDTWLKKQNFDFNLNFQAVIKK